MQKLTRVISEAEAPVPAVARSHYTIMVIEPVQYRGRAPMTSKACFWIYGRARSGEERGLSCSLRTKGTRDMASSDPRSLRIHNVRALRSRCTVPVGQKLRFTFDELKRPDGLTQGLKEA